MHKSESNIYLKCKMRRTGRAELHAQLEDLPVTDSERAFLADCIAGLSIKELCSKYDRCRSDISWRKKQLYDRWMQWDYMHNIRL